ncbi:hypothetical protein [Georgenia yuyongxinii]
MTYGEVATQLREALAGLIAHPRPYYEIGGRHAARDTPPARFREHAALIRRYHALVLRYVVELARTHTARADHRATVALRWQHRLERAVPPLDKLPDGRLPNAIELGTKHDNDVVELWRKAAVAAFIAREREFGPMRQQIKAEQEFVVLKDIADVMQALIRLDPHYRRLPGWTGLAGAESELSPAPGNTARGLASTTRRLSDWATARLTPESYTVDRIGYRPEPRSSAHGTVVGAIAALENLTTILQADFPRALSLRMIFRSQWKLSILAARLAHADGDTAAVAALTVRANIYAGLITAMRNVTGTVGDGIYAVSYGGVAADQIARTPASTKEQTARLLEALDQLDTRIARVARHGAATRVYLVATGDVMFVRHGPGGVRLPQPTFGAITPQANPHFYRLLSTLEPHQRPLPPESAAITQRARFTAMLTASPHASLTTVNGRAARTIAGRRDTRSAALAR